LKQEINLFAKMPTIIRFFCKNCPKINAYALLNLAVKLVDRV